MIPHPESIATPILAFIGAGITSASVWVLAQIPDSLPIPPEWIAPVGGLGTVGLLAFALRALWAKLEARDLQITKQHEDFAKERDAHRAEIADLNQEIRTEKSAQNRELIEALDRLNPRSEPPA